jgi:cytochrome c peroxidase
MKPRIRLNLIAAATTLAVAGLALAAAEPIQPIAPASDIDLAKVELGKKLYFDPRLSKSGFISCNSCHNLSMGGTDNLPSSIGHGWQQGPINSPTVLNSSMNVAQFWDGRAKDLKEQAAGPIANPGEMAFTHTLAVDMLASIPAYVKEFKLVFGAEEITIDHVTDAIAEFEKTLVTPNSRFDQWLLGDESALTAQEQQGYELFKSSGCVACHHGLAGVTGNDADRFKFKVPTLRNVELTYPYFHDGATNSLTKAVDIMGRLQLGREFTPEETTRIVAFLKTLTGEQPSFALPALPPSNENTPAPQPFEASDTAP